MNKTIKRVFIICLISFIGFIGIESVNAKVSYTACNSKFDIKTSVYDNYTTWNGHDIHNDTSWRFNSGGRIVYCSEKGVPLDGSGGSYVSYQSIGNSVSTDNIMATVLAYGYIGNNDSYCSIARIGTQVIVHMAGKEIATKNTEWRNLSEAQIKNMFDGDHAAAIAKYAYNLKTQVLTHGKILSTPAYGTAGAAAVAGDRPLLKYSEANRNFSGSYTNTNSGTILNTWTLGGRPSGISASISGQTLSIVSKNDATTTPLSLSKVYKTGSKAYRRKTGNSSQDTVYTTPPSNRTETGYVGYKYEEVGKAKIKIHKTDKYTGLNLANATFGIFTDDQCTIHTTDYLGNALADKQTDNDGIIEWTNIYYPLTLTSAKTYYIKETKTPTENQYQINGEQLKALKANEDGCIPVEIKVANVDAEQTVNKTLELNNIPYGNITILKQDADTGEGIEGVEFKILKNDKKNTPVTDINGNVVANVITNKIGVAEFSDIPYGDYILKEVKTTNSYKVLKEAIKFTLDKETDALKYKSQGTEALPLINKDDGFTYNLGDPNNDGKIDTEDVAILDKVIAKDETVTTAQKYACDVNLDKKVSSTDKDLMNTYITNLAEGKTPEELKTLAFEGLKKIKVKGELLLPFETYKLGDPTDDEIIDNNDLTIVQNIVNGTITPENVTKTQLYASDINGDGKVTEADLNLIRAYVVKDAAVDTSSIEWKSEIAFPDQFQKRVTIVVTNVPIDLKISKKSITNEKELAGAKIVIKTENGQIFKKYTSTTKAEEFYIPVGTYTLTETVSPKGFENLKTVIKFKVGPDGQAKILSVKSDMYKLVKSKEKNDTDLDHLIIYNRANKIGIPDTASSVTFLSIFVGLVLIGGGSYVIYNRYKTR